LEAKKAKKQLQHLNSNLDIAISEFECAYKPFGVFALGEPSVTLWFDPCLSSPFLFTHTLAKYLPCPSGFMTCLQHVGGE